MRQNSLPVTVDELEMTREDKREQELMNILTDLRDYGADMLTLLTQAEDLSYMIPGWYNGFQGIQSTPIFNRATSMLKTFRCVETKITEFVNGIMTFAGDNPALYDHLEIELYTSDHSEADEEKQEEQKEEEQEDEQEEDDIKIVEDYLDAEAETKLDEPPSELAYLNTCLPCDPPV